MKKRPNLTQQEKLAKITEQNKLYEAQLASFNQELERKEAALRDKEVQYQLLSKEYTQVFFSYALSFICSQKVTLYRDLSEAVAISFDSKIVPLS